MPISSCADGETTMSVYMPLMNSQQSKGPETPVYMHVTLLPYAHKHVCLKHCKYMFYCTATEVYIYTPYYCTYQLKTTNITPITC